MPGEAAGCVPALPVQIVGCSGPALGSLRGRPLHSWPPAGAGSLAEPRPFAHHGQMQALALGFPSVLHTHSIDGQQGAGRLVSGAAPAHSASGQVSAPKDD